MDCRRKRPLPSFIYGAGKMYGLQAVAAGCRPVTGSSLGAWTYPLSKKLNDPIHDKEKTKTDGGDALFYDGNWGKQENPIAALMSGAGGDP